MAQNRTGGGLSSVAYAPPMCSRRKQVSKRWSPMPTISTKRTTTSHLNSLKKKKTKHMTLEI